MFAHDCTTWKGNVSQHKLNQMHIHLTNLTKEELGISLD